MYKCYFVPSQCKDLFEGAAFKTLVFENHGERVELAVPELTPDMVAQVIETIKKQQQTYLKTLKTNDVIAIMDQAVQKWLDPQYELRQLAERWLPVITGYDREMIRLYINRYLRQFRKEKLQRMIDEDFPNPLILDEFRPRKSGGLYRAYGPEVMTHIFSGNVPILPLWSLTAGILLKSATFGKVSSSEPLFPVLFAKTLQEIDPDLAEAIAIVSWKGGEDALEKLSFSQSNAVIAYGGKEAIERIKEKVPSDVTFHAHGHKVSFGMLASECLAATKVWRTAKLAAHDVSWFDQQGCLSPHVFFVERGGKYGPREFAEMLANEMGNFQSMHPRATLTEEEQHAIVSQRSVLEFESYESEKVNLIKSEGNTAWTVVYRELTTNTTEELFPFSPLNRFITVIPVDNMLEVKQYIKGMTGYIQSVGVGCAPQHLTSIISMLGDAGVNRICAVGSMPQPQPGWHHDGRFHLADLVRFCDVESSLEDQMDEFDPYRD
ncbi:acyl-CoA reductase [Halalkalibacter suaedae]|uniref:Acyl-CoA reductase n=1 Tax=Halalkalibacter suaedae TaxID=2822140 RepID=A0A941ANQ9_9BACI|nr:acyl-CoA reductase [Bacillus suaedae]MBP3951925.1 acyl-CoA reductase [Bacillus suaedae]